MSYFSNGHRRRIMKDSIVAWFSMYGRSFPWRSTSNSYHVLVAEMLLRRTTASAAARVYPGFIHRFEQPAQLANARLSTIESMIETLGLQKMRSQHLKQMARCLVKDYDGVVPSDPLQLSKLPGVGQYVAAAVLNFVFGKHVPLIDGNVIHLMTRISGLTFKGPTDQHLLSLLESLDLDDASKFFYWGVIDLVAKVCLRKKPQCMLCPVQEICTWASKNAD
jgi:A/G-specific adenine glycosylase